MVTLPHYLAVSAALFTLGILGVLTGMAMLIEAARQLIPAVGAFFRHTVGFMVRDTEFDRVTGASEDPRESFGQ